MPQRKALVVGINSYPTRPLRNCVNDAEEIAAMLEMREYGFEVTTLLDGKATRRAILTDLQALFFDSPEFVVFYFAGHGVANDFSTYLASIDTEPIDVGIDLDYLRRFVQKKSSEGTTTVMILDCCHSGAASVRELLTSEARSATNNDFGNVLYSLGSGSVVIAACQPDELAYEEPSLRHGVFTYYLIEGMYGDAADSEGKVTIPNLYDHVSARFEAIVGQTPVFKGDISGRIVLGQNLAPRERVELPEEKIRDIEARAHDLMNEYIRNTVSDIETWKKERYRDACAMLGPKLHWFERQLTQYPKLQSREDFRSAYSTARSKLADIGHLMEGVRTRFGVVKRKLGSGTFGTVWQIESEGGMDIAYKVYHPMDLDNAEKLSRFNRGHRAMAQLNHPHIVKVHEFSDCPVGFVMDYIDGPNSRDFAHGGHDPAAVAFQLLTVAETLKHAHARGVIHRDVKPENIVMCLDEDSEQYRPHLTDFDLAWFSTATQFTREGFGSLVYAAPEQLAKPTSKVAHEATTDIYAFGQLSFFFICRRDPVPMLADNVRALQGELRPWRIEEPASKIVDLYDQCTQQNPKDRIQDFREICDRLFEIERLLKEFDHQRIIGFAGFAKQLAFSIVGLAPQRQLSNTAFYTTSGRTSIAISATDEKAKETQVIFTLRSQVAPVVQGVASHKDLRELLNRRIDASLREYPQASRRAGKQGPFETFIHIRSVPMNVDGVETCRQILMRVVDCIESG